MSRTPVPSPLSHPQQASCLDSEVLAPRPVDAAQRPVDSPVHALQRELARLGPQQDLGDSGEDKPPGWLRLALPLAMSMGLWFVIIRFIGAIWTK